MGGSDGSGGSGGYAYRGPSNQRHGDAVTLGSGVSRSTFVWHNSPGLAPPADLWVEAEGRLAVQISSLGVHPFARAGLDVVPLEAEVPYSLVLVREHDAVSVTLARQGAKDGATLLRTRVPTGKRVTDDAPIADLVVPEMPWRSSVSIR
jgi:hypothetical protein